MEVQKRNAEMMLSNPRLIKIEENKRKVTARHRTRPPFFFLPSSIVVAPDDPIWYSSEAFTAVPGSREKFFDDFKRFWERLSEFPHFMQMRAGGGGVKWRQPVLTAGLIYWLKLGKWKRLTWKANSKWPPVWHERSRRARYFQRLIRFFKKYVNFEGKRNSTISMTYHNKNHLMNFDI